MNFAVILAGGIGSRMGNTDTPKQYMQLGNKPILAHTVEKFFVSDRFSHIIVLTPAAWVGHTANLIQKALGKTDKISVIEGGSTRNETLYNAIRFVEENYGLDDDTILVTHDAVRPFVTHRIIEENIAAARQYGACDTVIPATDTIVESGDGQMITCIPDRKKMYQGQTPQSFKAKKLKALYESLTDAEKDILTDACKIFSIKGEPVYLVQGEVFNIKITYPFDLKIAKTMLKAETEND